MIRLLLLCFVLLAASPPAQAQDVDSLTSLLHGLEQRVTQLEYERESPARLFGAYASSVVRIQAGLRSGSGFFVAIPERVIITNDHVLGRARDIRVELDDTTVVAAQVVTRDRISDLAVLRIAPGACRACTNLPLAADRSVLPGEPVVAMGYPLSQDASLTRGVVSSIRDRVILSDVNLNPGNSGGPLLTLDGEVIAVNSFLEADDVGPGVSGSIAVDQLLPLLADAADSMARLPPVARAHLPAIGRDDRYSVSALLKAVPDALADTGVYRQYAEIHAEEFTVAIGTPLYHFVSLQLYEDEVAEERRKREVKAGIPWEDRFSVFEPYKDWLDYVGDVNVPAVSVRITPQLRETTGSILRNVFTYALVGVMGQSRYRFRGDVDWAEVRRNGEPVTPLRGGTRSTARYLQSARIDLRDVADEGLYFFNPEVFRPDPTPVPPRIEVVIGDLKHPSDTVKIELSDSLVARIWNDFVPYYQERPHRDPIVVARVGTVFEVGETADRQLHTPRGRAQVAIADSIWGIGLSVRAMRFDGNTVIWEVGSPDQPDRTILVGMRETGVNRVQLSVVADDPAVRSRVLHAVANAIGPSQ